MVTDENRIYPFAWAGILDMGLGEDQGELPLDMITPAEPVPMTCPPPEA